MKFTVVSHACLYIENSSTRLLIDPWLIGSCYWRSWWNYPEPNSDLIEHIKPTHIYITHLHWDHYHGPSLRKFEKFNPQVILPKHFNKRMLNDCREGFRFKNIIEIDHGKKVNIGDDFSITSYQFNPIIIDSSLVVETDNITLLNSNDSKVFGSSLKQIIANHKKFNFVFRSHSSASPIPHCIRGIDPEKTSRSPKDYAEDFISFCSASKASYAIPFASSHIYLHPHSRKFNKFYSNPKYIKAIFDSRPNLGQNCVIMPSGSSWSKNDGFNIFHHDYTLINEHIKQGIAKKQDAFKKLFLKEKQIKLNLSAFHSYFYNFLNSIKFPFALRFKFAFLINEENSNKKFLCIINGKEKKTKVIEIFKEKEIYHYELSFVILTPVYVFNDCNFKIMHNTFGPSKLLEIIMISKKSHKDLNTYFALIDFYENDCLPVSNLISSRNIVIILRRWRELMDALYYFYVLKIKHKKISDLYK